MPRRPYVPGSRVEIASQERGFELLRQWREGLLHVNEVQEELPKIVINLKEKRPNPTLGFAESFGRNAALARDRLGQKIKNITEPAFGDVQYAATSRQGLMIRESERNRELAEIPRANYGVSDRPIRWVDDQPDANEAHVSSLAIDANSPKAVFMREIARQLNERRNRSR